MDIQTWLNETVLPQQPPSPPEQRDDDPPSRPEGVVHVSKQKRRRKQSTSDSSLLDALPRRKKGVPPERQNFIEHDARESASSDASHPASHSDGSAPSRPYRRKPRCKTRPERYEPVSKEVKGRGTHTHRPQRDESKRRRRSSRRSKVDKPDSGIVQSFHAKNVPRDRLTLRPREKLGLFSKGRVSSPVKGRGLPDLVFSEMKFLQKHKNQPEAGPQPGSPKKKRKKDPAHAKEEEISAYFTSVRPALAERDSNIQAKVVSHEPRLRGTDRKERQRSAADNVIPSVESADKSTYLGFGSRGPRHESGSYISWSESVRAPSPTPVHPRIESAIDNDQLDPLHGGQVSGNTDGGEVLRSQPAPPTVTRRRTDGSGDRFQVSSLPPTNERLSRSHSLPQRTSSPRRINLVDRAARRRTLESAASPSSMPPFIQTHSEHDRGQSHPANVPNQSGLGNHSLSAQLPGRHDPLGYGTEQPTVEEDAQQTLSSLGRILEDCNTVFHERRKAEALQASNARAVSSGRPSQSIMKSNSERYPTIRSMSSVRFAGVETHHVPSVPTISGPSIYEQQQQRRYDFADEHFDADEIQQTRFNAQHEYFGGGGLDSYEQEWDEEAELAALGTMLGPAIEDEANTQHLNDGWNEMGARSNAIVKPGFWRPNKLY